MFILFIMLVLLMVFLFFLIFGLGFWMVFLDLGGYNFYFMLSISLYQILFIYFLVVILFFILVFSSFYMQKEIYYFYFVYFIFLFVGSMFFLVVSFSIFFLIFFWDMLGLTSFFLVLFYLNFESINGSLVTLLSNRLGDFFIFCFVLLGIYYFSDFLSNISFIFIFLLLAGMTKSAQFPFSGWLPKAMSAPTPVSSLVHSSTLVTAGLFLFFLFNDMFFFSFLLFVFFLGLLTLFFSSFLACLEVDMKKVVALSTLSQIGLSFLSFALGYYFLSFFHLISHALFKSLLFLQVGFMIFYSMGQQDMRGSFWFFGKDYWLQIQMLISLFNLCGLFFFNGFYSKHLILDYFFSSFFGFFISFIFIISVMLTLFYSLKLVYIFLSDGKMYLNKKTYISYFLSFFLVFFSMIMMYFLLVNFFMMIFIMIEVEQGIFFVFVLCLLMFFLVLKLKKGFLLNKIMGNLYMFFFSFYYCFGNISFFFYFLLELLLMLVNKFFLDFLGKSNWIFGFFYMIFVMFFFCL